MIRVEADANDLKQLVKIGKEFPGLNILEKLDNIRITEEARIAFDVILRESKPAVSAIVQISLSQASVASLHIDICQLGFIQKWLPDCSITGGNKIASWIHKDITSVLEQKCAETLTRESLSRLSFDLQTFWRKKLGLPFIVNIADVSLLQQRFVLNLELNQEACI